MPDEALQMEHWPIEKLVDYARNPRKNDHAVDDLAAAIKEFGFRVPVIAKSDGSVVDGHLRLKAAKKLKMKEVPVVLADDMTDAQIKAFRIAVNRMAELADWDNDLLKLEFEDLLEMDFDMDLLGFKDGFIEQLLHTTIEGETDEDDVPEIEDESVAIAVPRDIWILGKHRLVCGDCTDPLIVDMALDGVVPHLMVTDPPYGVEYDADWRNKQLREDGTPIGGRAVGKVLNDDRADWREAWQLFPGDVAYVWHASLKSPQVAESLEVCGFELRAHIIWDKGQFTIGRGDYQWQHEPCWYVVKKSGKGHWNKEREDARKQTTVWNIPKPKKSETGHSTQKPVACMERPVLNNSSVGQAVYEPFSGSGTTIIACEKHGRSCHAIELNPAYIDVAIRRWQDFTGEEAVLEADGRTWEQVKADRAQEIQDRVDGNTEAQDDTD